MQERLEYWLLFCGMEQNFQIYDNEDFQLSIVQYPNIHIWSSSINLFPKYPQFNLAPEE